MNRRRCQGWVRNFIYLFIYLQWGLSLVAGDKSDGGLNRSEKSRFALEEWAPVLLDFASEFRHVFSRSKAWWNHKASGWKRAVPAPDLAGVPFVKIFRIGTTSLSVGEMESVCGEGVGWMMGLSYSLPREQQNSIGYWALKLLPSWWQKEFGSISWERWEFGGGIRKTETWGDSKEKWKVGERTEDGFKGSSKKQGDLLWVTHIEPVK